MVKKVLVFSSFTNSEKVAKDKVNLEFDYDLKKIILKSMMLTSFVSLLTLLKPS
jgi:hypothetical protein